MELIEPLIDLMCAVAVRRLKGAGWNGDECRAAGSRMADELGPAIREVVSDELPEAAAGLHACGKLNEERLQTLLTALVANRAVEIADRFVRQRVCESN